MTLTQSGGHEGLNRAHRWTHGRSCRHRHSSSHWPLRGRGQGHVRSLWSLTTWPRTKRPPVDTVYGMFKPKHDLTSNVSMFNSDGIYGSLTRDESLGFISKILNFQRTLLQCQPITCIQITKTYNGTHFNPLERVDINILKTEKRLQMLCQIMCGAECFHLRCLLLWCCFRGDASWKINFFVL